MTTTATPTLREQLQARLRERLAERQAVQAELDAVIAAPAAEARDLNDTEAAAFAEIRGRLTPIDADLTSLDDRLADLTSQDEARVRAADLATRAGTPTVRVGNEPRTYARHDHENSYFRDLGLAHIGHDPNAAQRLARHGAEIRVDARDRPEYRDITRVDGAGGEFVPPLWLVDDFAALARAGRITAGLCRNLPLPGGTDSLNIPRVTTGTATAVQTADNAAVAETDIVTTSVAIPVRTIAGQQDVALQLLEQSPLAGGLDQMLFADLAADYAVRLDIQVINGSGSSGQVTGILQTGSIVAVSYTDASPTVPEFYPSVAQATSQVVSNRLMPATHVVMHPRRWYWQLGALDSSNRPFVVSPQTGPYMAMGVNQMNQGEFEGLVGFSNVGLPIYIDANIPTTLGGGTEDAVIVARMDDNLLFEGSPRTRALAEVLSGTLTVRFQLYNYVAFTAGRYPKANGAITGTGLAAPSGF